MEEYSITELQRLLKTNELSSEKLVHLYLKQIEKIDKKGPKVNAILEINPEAIKIAQQLDLERQTGKIRSELHGIPVILKDNIDTQDKMMTTAGSLALLNNFPSKDAFIVKNLRDAGAIILAKANLSEWANFRSTHSASGWSSRGGQTKNPYVLDRSPCGSSSGSAVAVATNMCTVAIGTETDGSVICPSHINSIVGLKPTIGLLSRTGIIPIAHSQDTAGPMGRTVEDVAILLGTMVGPSPQDPLDPSTMDPTNKFQTDYTQNLNLNALQGKRVGVARNFFGVNHHVDPLMEEMIKTIQKLGGIIVDPANIDFPDEVGDAEFLALLYEFKTDLNKYLVDLDAKLPVHSLEELIDFNSSHSTETMPFFRQEILKMAHEKKSLENDEYLKAIQTCKTLAQEKGLDTTLKEFNLDVIIAPTGSPAWPIDHINGDHHTGSSTSPAAISGYPSITIPMGYVFELPVGISFIGPKFSEKELLGFAYALEQAIKVRHPPKFLPSI
ncbi:amidase [Candidatus Lokiarchaeum ossiferum]|uniref:amidase n=1 Tax=Candidatus Lokiarchaeum ossiferum TaxID=2951803 RepID=UPI00352E7681